MLNFTGKDTVLIDNADAQSFSGVGIVD